MNNIKFHYKQWCKTFAKTPRHIERIENDGIFTKAFGANNELLYARKNRIDVKNLDKPIQMNIK